jgi:hypothetical protein
MSILHGDRTPIDRVQVWQLHHSVFREKGGDLFTVGDNGKKVEQKFCGVSHGRFPQIARS